MPYTKCMLCARACGKDRSRGERGFCKMGASPVVARASVHMWEEPPISGTRGSGTVFFSGCSLGCIYCQNREISRGGIGREITEQRLADIMLELRDSGVHNVNFVTGTHFAPSIVRATSLAREHGFALPTVYNTGAYDTPQTVKMLSDSIDIWLPDMKYYLPRTAREYSCAENLPSVARAAIDEMVRLAPEPRFDSDGIMTRGVIVRILLLPAHLAEAKLSVKYLFDRYGDSIYMSLMSQYTPPEGMPRPLDRRVSRAEYRELVDYAASLGVSRAFVQEVSSAAQSFIPTFDGRGV